MTSDVYGNCCQIKMTRPIIQEGSTILYTAQEVPRTWKITISLDFSGERDNI